MDAQGRSAGAPALPERRPLFNEAAERGVLGAILLDAPKVLDFCFEKQLVPESFYLRAHTLIFEAMREMANASRPVDVLTLAERLAARGQLEEIGGAAYLNGLLDAIPTPAHAEYYIDLVRQQHLLRRIVTSARNAESECYTAVEDADHVLAKVEQDFFSITEAQHGLLTPWPQAVRDTLATLEHIYETKKGHSGIPTGYADLDAMLLGLHDEELIVIAARPSMGKTSLALNILEHVVLGSADGQPRPVGMFSLEMSREQLVLRLLCSHARVPLHRIAAGTISKANHGLLIQAADLFSKAPIALDDTGGLDILELRARARRMKKKHGIALLIVDYLQMLHAKDRSREGRQQEIAHISGSLKTMAKELHLPVLALSQLNRAPEARDREGKPRLADLRDSGAIEQDADVVCLLYRPDKYKDEGADAGGYPAAPEAGDGPNVARVLIAKQRNGPTGEVKLVFRDDLMRFETLAATGVGAPPPAEGPS